MRKVAALSIAVFTACALSFADTASLPAAADTSISERNPDNNFGGDQHVSAGRDGSG